MNFNGGKSFDDRGSLTYFNEFSPIEMNIKRFYIVENFAAGMVRAWHGHKNEDKWVTCISGAAIIGYVPSLELCYGEVVSKVCDIQRTVLNANSPQLIYLSKGGYNGAKSLLPETRLLYFSTSTLEESKVDDYRLAWDYFGEEVWKVENR